jgi:hypothetical protein
MQYVIFIKFSAKSKCTALLHVIDCTPSVQIYLYVFKICFCSWTTFSPGGYSSLPGNCILTWFNRLFSNQLAGYLNFKVAPLERMLHRQKSFHQQRMRRLKLEFSRWLWPSHVRRLLPQPLVLSLCVKVAGWWRTFASALCRDKCEITNRFILRQNHAARQRWGTIWAIF